MTHSESNEGNLDIIQMCYTVISEQVAAIQITETMISRHTLFPVYIVESILTKSNVNFLSIQKISPCVNYNVFNHG